MISDFSKEKLPPIYKRNGKDCYLDPIREKLIQITPEETIRQQVISYLLDKLEIPHTMIRVEERLSHYGINTKNRPTIPWRLSSVRLLAYTLEKNRKIRS